jgi:hypothetical protein
MLDLLALLWLFETSQPAHSTVTARDPEAVFAAPANRTNGFTIRVAAVLERSPVPQTLVEIPGVVSLRSRLHDPLDRDRQNYPAFKLPDGSVPVLEADLHLHSSGHPDWKRMTIGIPLAMIEPPEGRHEIILNFTGARWTMYVDGRLLDNDFPFGYPRWAERNSWKLDAERVLRADLYFPALQPVAKAGTEPWKPPGVQYWTPPGHNTWVGDVATCYYAGRYHVFYLFDRRHHQSKFGCGAHYFEHLSTKDLKTWTEHEAATPLEEQWECIGTGTPFVFNNQLHLSYGLHTTRVFPAEKTALPAQWDYLRKNGRTGSFPGATTAGVPAGSTYAVSADGVSRFAKSQTLFHPCENPSVYLDPDGKLRMMANYRSDGIWESDSVAGGWRCVNPGFPPGGDCTFFFRWGDYDYIIGGFTRLWSKPAALPLSAYEDVVRQGLDFYDGLSVPSITRIRGGRYLMAGWVPIRGWGGALVIRELIQYPDGRIGSKWLRELLPPTAKPKRPADSIAAGNRCEIASRSFLLTFQVTPSSETGRLGVLFLPGSAERGGCELQIRPKDRRAQFGPALPSGFAGPEKSLREGGGPHAIENLVGVERPFTVRVIVKSDEKLGGSLIDCEVAGQRTLIAYRPDLTVKSLAFRTEGLELKRVRIAPIIGGDERAPLTPGRP